MQQAASETDPAKSRALYNQADARIWALGAVLPLFETPQIDAVRKDVANAGAWGPADPFRRANTGFVQ